VFASGGERVFPHLVTAVEDSGASHAFERNPLRRIASSPHMSIAT